MYGIKCLVLRRRKLRFFLGFTVTASVIFVIYQMYIYTQISKVVKPNKDRLPDLLLGTHPKEHHFYVPDNYGYFKCIHSMEEIEFIRVNDNYCDCLDGSDEPGTNACPNSIFHCTDQTIAKNFLRHIHSSKVNDGICDCCDGSDEWENNKILAMDSSFQTKFRRFQVPCPNFCIL